MMHISKAVKKYPQLVPVLKGEFDEEVWNDMIFYGETSRFLVGIPNPIVYFEADLEKPPIDNYLPIQKNRLFGYT